MASSNSKKRKSICSDLIFELSEEEVAPESEIPETNGEPKNKVLKLTETELLPGYDPQILEQGSSSTIPAQPSDDNITPDDLPCETSSPLVQISESLVLPSDDDLTSDEPQSKVDSPLLLNPESILLSSGDEGDAVMLQSELISNSESIPKSIDVPDDDDDEDDITLVASDDEDDGDTIVPSDEDVDGTKPKAVSPVKRIPKLVSKKDDFTGDVQDFTQDIDFHNEPCPPPVQQMALNQQFPTLTEQQSSISITFSDKKIAKLYKYKFLKFIDSFVELEAIEDDDDLSIRVIRDSDLDPSQWIIVDRHNLEDMELDSSPVKHKKKRRKKSKKSTSPFVIDIKPEGNNQNKSLYSFSKFEIGVNDKPNNDDAKVCHPTQSCFNCAGSHSLRDCSVPKNHGRISAARNKHRSQYKNPKYQRYHISPDEKNYSHLTPGHISDKLREALGLRKNELPSYIYKMRRLGYPPGWLEEAKIYHSDSDNNDSTNKIQLRRDRKATKLDPNKIVDYPGFNVPCDKNIKDEFRYYNVPAYSHCYHKSEMVKYFEKISKPGYDKNKEKDHGHGKTKSSHKITEELMTPGKKGKQVMDMDKETHSPTLLDLEERKKSLLAALTESLNTASDELSSNENEGNARNENEGNASNENSGVEKELDTEKPLPVDTTNEEIDPQSQDVQSIKSTIYGTPLLKSCTPYATLPDAELFMQNISPVINFENLPNSTGKYRQMKKILGKVRKVMNDSNGKA